MRQRCPIMVTYLVPVLGYQNGEQMQKKTWLGDAFSLVPAQAFTSWNWYNFLVSNAPPAKRVLRVSIDETSVRRVFGRCLEGVWWVFGRCSGSVWRVFGGCLDGVLRVLGGCLEGVWKVFGGCLGVVWGLFGGVFEGWVGLLFLEDVLGSFRRHLAIVLASC